MRPVWVRQHGWQARKHVRDSGGVEIDLLDVVASRQENLPQTGTARACGTPVVAFNAAGFPDVMDLGSTGYLM